MVVKMLNGKDFKKNFSEYPQTPEKLAEQSSKYEKMYKIVTKNINNAPSYNEFELLLGSVYNKDKRNAVAKLMQLSFCVMLLINFHQILINLQSFGQIFYILV